MTNKQHEIKITTTTNKQKHKKNKLNKKHMNAYIQIEINKLNNK